MKKYPLSKTEYGIYVEQTTREDCAYNLPLIIGLPEKIDTDKFENAFKSPCLADVVRR